MKYQIITGNNIDTLKQYPDNHFDSIVTDPPYGIEFLGKDWDSNTGAIETWQECLRVLKPGGYILAFSAARTYHQLATNIESVGFEIRDQIMWIYGSGFPKAQDVGKAIQKRQGVEKTQPRKYNPPGSVGGHNDGSYHKKTHDVVTTSPEAQQWAGWKTALKPAHEPIVMARKPFKGSTVDNVLKHGVGALNIDATRIPGETLTYPGGGVGRLEFNQAEPDKWQGDVVTNDAGRYPSNVIGEISDEYQKYFYCPKVSRAERHQGNVSNNHPTVKPVALMRYLITLVTPPGGHVLDPFNGSGSTGMAAVELGYEYTGCELDPAYADIAQKRIEAWYRKTDISGSELPPEWFDEAD